MSLSVNPEDFLLSYEETKGDEFFISSLSTSKFFAINLMMNGFSDFVFLVVNEIYSEFYVIFAEANLFLLSLIFCCAETGSIFITIR